MIVNDVQNIATHITTGIIVDTNDPQEMGRVRVYCPSLGDLPNTHIENLPWCRYVAPFGGILDDDAITRGPNNNLGTSSGPISYGFWAIPKVGSTAVVSGVDGDPNVRLWLGCIHMPGMNHTLPNGRWGGEDGKKGGPLTSTDEPIQPLFDNYKTAFGTNNPIFATRGGDMQVAALTEQQAKDIGNGVKKDEPLSFAADMNKQTYDNASAALNAANMPAGAQTIKTAGQNAPKTELKIGDEDEDHSGYGSSRINPDLKYRFVNQNRDSHVYSWTTPGFHSLTMNDRPDWSRVRLRSSTGHQIIMDDTNEVIYINTSVGNNWIELHKNGNIDIYSAKKISVHSSGDINYTTDSTFRVLAQGGIHLLSAKDIRITAATDIGIKSSTNIRQQAANSVYSQSGSSMHLRAGGNIIQTGSNIHLNGPSASPANPENAFFSSRIPQHEPWPRSDSQEDTSKTPKHAKFDDESTW